MALLSVIVAIAVAVWVVLRPESTRNAGEVVGFSPPPVTPPSSSSAAPGAGLRVALLRGGRTGCVTTGGCNENNYDARLTYLEGWVITTDASGGTGYVAGNQQRPKVNFEARLPDLLRAKPPVVIVEGSVSDMRYSYGTVKSAAAQLYESIRSQLPKSKILVVGPIWAGSPPPAALMSVERALKAATTGRVTKFMDPIAENWFAGANAKLMGSDHVTPTNEGHRLIAQRITEDLRDVALPTGN